MLHYEDTLDQCAFIWKKGVQLTLLIVKMAFYNIYYNVIFLKILNCCYDAGVLLSMSCAILMWQTIYNLFKFNGIQGCISSWFCSHGEKLLVWWVSTIFWPHEVLLSLTCSCASKSYKSHESLLGCGSFINNIYWPFGVWMCKLLCVGIKSKFTSWGHVVWVTRDIFTRVFTYNLFK